MFKLLKRILKLVLIFIIILPFIKLNAETYSNWSEEIPNVEQSLIQEEERYLWYSYEEADIEYQILNKSDRKFIDQTQFKLVENYSFEFPEREENRMIEYNQYTIELNQEEAEFININSISSKLNIEKIEVFENAQKINYQIINCNSCNIEENLISTFPSTELILKLDSSIKTDDIKIKITFNNNQVNFHSWTIAFGVEKQIFNYSKKFSLIECNYIEDNKCVIEYQKDDTWNNYKTGTKTKFRYVDKLFKYYNLNKIYKEGYSTKQENCIKDEETKKIFYRYKIEEINFDQKEFEVSQNPILENTSEYLIPIKEEQQEETQLIEEVKKDNAKDLIAYKTDDKKEEKQNSKLLIFIKYFVFFAIISGLFLFIFRKMSKKEERIN